MLFRQHILKAASTLQSVKGFQLSQRAVPSFSRRRRIGRVHGLSHDSKDAGSFSNVVETSTLQTEVGGRVVFGSRGPKGHHLILRIDDEFHPVERPKQVVGSFGLNYQVLIAILSDNLTTGIGHDGTLES